jgi:hypothetical protein
MKLSLTVFLLVVIGIGIIFSSLDEKKKEK